MSELIRLAFFKSASVTLSIFLMLAYSIGARGHVPHDEVTGLVMSPTFSRDRTAFSIVRGSLFHTLNGGFDWSRLSNGIFCDPVMGVKLSPAFASDRTVFLWCRSDVFRSEDAGRTWSATGASFKEALAVLAISPRFAEDRMLLAAGRSGTLFRSTNAGGHWDKVPLPGVRVTALAWVNRQIILGTDAGTILNSMDSGMTWSELGRHPDGAQITAIDVISDKNANASVIGGTATHGAFVIEPGGGLARRASRGIDDPYITSLAHYGQEDRQILLATTWNAGVYRSDDGGMSWKLRSQGLRTSRQAAEYKRPGFRDVAVSEDGVLLVGSFTGVYRSENLGQDWYKLETTFAHIVSLDISPATSRGYSVALATYGSGVLVSDDGGTTWRIRNTGLSHPRMGPVAFSPDFPRDRRIYAGQYGAIFQSSDEGAHWRRWPTVNNPQDRNKREMYKKLEKHSPALARQISADMDPYFLDYLPPTPLVFAVSPRFGADRTMFVAMHPTSLLRSLDAGETYSRIWDTFRQKVFSLAISPGYSEDGTLFSGLESGVYRSRDRGVSWERIGENRDLTRAIVAVSPAYARDRTIFAGSSSGLYRSRDGGDSWQRLNLGTPASEVSGLDVSPAFKTDGRLLVQVRAGDLMSVRVNGDDATVATTGTGRAGYDFSSVVRREIAPLFKFSPRFETDRTVFAASMQKVLKSTDGGDTWIELRRPVRYEPELAFTKWFFVPVSMKGNWRVQHNSRKFSSSEIIHASEAGDSVTLHFVGTRVDWIGVEGPGHGRAKVFIDDQLRATVDQYARTQKALAQSFSATNLAYGPHTLTIEVLGSASEQSKGTRIDVDAFDIMR